MNNNLIQIAFVIDKSGSMSHLVDDTVGGFNAFIEKYQNESIDGLLTVTLFDDKYRFLHDQTNLADAKPMTRGAYMEGGMGCTALYDAVGATIDHVGQRLADMNEEDRPGKILFVITTDGYENASQKYSRSKVKEMIQHQTEKYSWEFIFLGANLNAEETADSIGIKAERAMNYCASSGGVKAVYNVAGEIGREYVCATQANSSATIDSLVCSLKDENGFIDSGNLSTSAIDAINAVGNVNAVSIDDLSACLSHSADSGVVCDCSNITVCTSSKISDLNAVNTSAIEASVSDLLYRGSTVTSAHT